MDSTPVKIDIRKIKENELADFLEKLNERSFRAKQIQHWLWARGATDFEVMSNLSQNLRSALDENFVINPIIEDLVQKSSDGTIKSRFALHDGHKIESVLIPVPEDNRYTVCVSSQVGCSLTCKFCATGRMKRIRNLDPGEIYDQVRLVNEQSLSNYGHRLSNIVFMGMGEPLLAYKNVMDGIKLICSEEGLGFSPKRITVSTAGIAKMIEKLADDQVKFNLALSLHAADDHKRNQIMPINEQNNLAKLMKSLEYFYQKTKNRISYEYILLNDFNDSEEDAINLSKLCKAFPVRVNIINYNPIDEDSYSRTGLSKTDAFARVLLNHGVRVTVRKSRGEDIDAACGQLANK